MMSGYVDVEALFTRDGQVIPRRVFIKEAQGFSYCPVEDLQGSIAAVSEDGLAELCFLCRIAGAAYALFYEGDHRWRVEGRLAEC